MSEPQAEYIVQPHWSETDARQTFVQAVVDLGLDGQSVSAILGVDRVSEFEGTAQEALDVLVDYATQHQLELREELRPQEARHGEAQSIAWANIFLEDGTQISVTARQGAVPDDVVSTVLALTDALATLKQFGIRTTKTPPRVVPPVQVRDAPGPTEFWGAVRKYIGPGRAFENKAGVANWLSQFATGKGYNWIEAIKAMQHLDHQHDKDEFVGGIAPLD